MLIPEDIINDYQFNITTNINQLKTYLINHYNAETLTCYKNSNLFLTKDEIFATLPNKIIEFYTLNSKNVVKKKEKEKFWTEDEEVLNQFKAYMDLKYVVSETADVKFKSLMEGFNEHTSRSYPVTWSKNYDTMCQKLNIKYEKKLDERFANKGGNGTCFVFLKSKNKKDIIVTTNHIKPQIFDHIPYIPISK
ncbi:MAG TPA: hypothetical protein VLG50_07440 [Candidatus Saccharimonadales bacterium]|nr:hypothetical protein [Candidatus Saccharimonadales bacterium]